MLKLQQTMSSLEIATLTEKRHDHVLRDIRQVFAEVGIDESRFGGIYLDTYNREKPCYHLPKAECDLIVTGYSAKYRWKVIQRWQELEEAIKATMVLPQDYESAIRSLLDQEVERKRLAAEAITANNIIEHQVKVINNKEVRTDCHSEYISVKRVRELNPTGRYSHQVLTRISEDMELEVEHIFDLYKKQINTYHRDVWLTAYPRAALPT